MVQPFQNHTRMPCLGVHCFSFACQPESAEYTGSYTFKRGTLNLTVSDRIVEGTLTGKVSVFTLNMTRMRISADGKCSLVGNN